MADRKLRFLKLDSIHPLEYLITQQQQWKQEFPSLSRKAYYDKLVALRCNFSDFYTHHLQQYGWEAEEFFINDWMYIYKIAKELYGNKYAWKRLIHLFRLQAGFIEPEWKLKVLADYIETYQPDVIFCREHTNIPGSFWKPYRNRIFLVSRLSAHLPQNWSPLDFDLIYTDLPHYRDFFTYNKVETLFNQHGFDERLLAETSLTKEQYDVVFAGGLDAGIFSQRTSFFAEIAGSDEYRFQWWGYYSGAIDERLLTTYKGVTGGLSMYNIYRNSKIVINDYIDIAGGTAVNQRMFEVMGTGSLLLTRASASIADFFPEGTYVTYSSLEECKEKIRYYLTHEEERKRIAAAGQQVILQKYSYKKLMEQLSSELKERINK